ncbi:MAG: hypothetical protein AAF226_13585, partial [Verrucomicrobiota bacterium]
MSQTRFVGIFPRALLLSLTGVVLALFTFAVTVIRREQDMLKDNLLARAELLAASVDRVTANAVVEEDYTVVIDQYTKMVASRPEIRYAVVTNQRDGSSNIFRKTSDTADTQWTYESLEGEFWQPEARDSHSAIVQTKLCEEEVLHFWYPFSYSGIDWGWIHVGMSLDEYRENARSLYLIVVSLAVPGLLIGVGLSLTFARKLTQPISMLQQFAQQVAAGDLSRRVEIKTR